MLETIAILAVIVINALIAFFMEMQARSSMNALKKMEAILANVIRDGEARPVPAEKLVPGDLVQLEAGDIIPADGRLTTVHRLQCDESSLTGESLPVEKTIEVLPPDTLICDLHNMVFKGAAVINGNGKMIITGIGTHTQLGAITTLVENSAETVTPLDKKLNLLSRKLIWVTLAMTTIFAVTGFIQGKALLTIIETSIALAVAAIPEGLPVVATVALAYGMLLMGRRNAIIKQLSSVETLGSTGVILTDKTGTLTENKIQADIFAFPAEKVRVHIENNRLKFPGGPVRESAKNQEKHKHTEQQSNNACETSGDPVEVALMQIAAAADLDIRVLTSEYERVAEIPFNSELMMMGTLHRTSSGYFTAAKGSVERLLDRCTKLQSCKLVEDLNNGSKKTLLLKAEKMAASGLRVLAFAYHIGEAADRQDFLSGLTYIGKAGFLAPQ